MVLFREFQIKTGGRLDALDITPEIREVINESGISNGSVLVFSPHTTCSVLLGRGGLRTVAALERTMERIAPSDGYYAHDDLTVRTENLVEDEPANGPAHIMHAFLGRASESVPVIDGEPILGVEQRILFVELDCSRERRYYVQAVGE